MKRRGEQNNIFFQKKAQLTVEYAVMFVAIVAVIIIASTNFISPAVNRFFNGVGNIIDNATTAMQGHVVIGGGKTEDEDVPGGGVEPGPGDPVPVTE